MTDLDGRAAAFRDANELRRTDGLALVRELAAAGLSDREISRRTGLGASTVGRWLARVTPDEHTDNATSSGGAMTTATAEPEDELARTKRQLAEANEKVQQLQAQYDGKAAGVRTHDRRVTARMPTERLRSGALPEGAGDDAGDDFNAAEVADKILRRHRGY